MSLSFENDIRPLFRDRDVGVMSYAFDLSSYDGVKEHAEAIYQRLANGSMPCDGAWPPEKIENFKQWKDEGMEP